MENKGNNESVSAFQISQMLLKLNQEDPKKEGKRNNNRMRGEWKTPDKTTDLDQNHSLKNQRFNNWYINLKEKHILYIVGLKKERKSSIREEIQDAISCNYSENLMFMTMDSYSNHQVLNGHRTEKNEDLCTSLGNIQWSFYLL
jgi:hypothetical protein